MVQWLGLHFHCRGPGLIPGRGTTILDPTSFMEWPKVMMMKIKGILPLHQATASHSEQQYPTCRQGARANGRCPWPRAAQLSVPLHLHGPSGRPPIGLGGRPGSGRGNMGAQNRHSESESQGGRLGSVGPPSQQRWQSPAPLNLCCRTSV